MSYDCIDKIVLRKVLSLVYDALSTRSVARIRHEVSRREVHRKGSGYCLSYLGRLLPYTYLWTLG